MTPAYLLSRARLVSSPWSRLWSYSSSPTMSDQLYLRPPRVTQCRVRPRPPGHLGHAPARPHRAPPAPRWCARAPPARAVTHVADVGLARQLGVPPAAGSEDGPVRSLADLGWRLGRGYWLKARSRHCCRWCGCRRPLQSLPSLQRLTSPLCRGHAGTRGSEARRARLGAARPRVLTVCRLRCLTSGTGPPGTRSGTPPAV